MSSLKQIVSCIDGYDPDALPVDTARAAIRSVLTPVGTNERVALRSSLGRVLGARHRVDHRRAGARQLGDGRLRAARSDLAPRDTRCATPARPARAGSTGSVRAGQCVRIMTGAVMPPGSTPSCRRSSSSVEASRSRAARAQRATTAAWPARIWRRAAPRSRRPRPASGRSGLLASLGRAEVPVRRRLRVAFFSTGDELRSIGEPLEQRLRLRQQPLHALGHARAPGLSSSSTWASCATTRRALEAAFSEAAASADAVITSGGVSVGEADSHKPIMAELGEVLFWRIAMRPGRPMAIGRSRAAASPSCSACPATRSR